METTVPPSLSAASPPRCRRLRKVARVLALTILALLLVFVTFSAVVSYRYKVPFTEAARSVLRETTQGLILAVVAVYDPCTPGPVPLGPAEELPSGDWARLEEHLRDSATIGGYPRARVTVKGAHNERIVRGRFPFAYQTHDEPRLHELRRKYCLDAVVAGARDEWDALVRLRNWTRSRFRRRDYQPFQNHFDALEVLDRDLRNPNGASYDYPSHYDPCHLFPLLYCQVVLSLGHQARLASIRHGVAEVWSNQYRKWAAMDVELNWHYERGGVPLSLLEVHEEIYRSGPTQVRIVRGEQWSGDKSTTQAHLGVDDVPVEDMIAHHRYIDLSDLRNDWMTNRYFRGHPARGERSALVFVDPRDPPWPGVPSLLRRVTSDPADFGWTLNQAELWAAEGGGPGALRLGLKTVTPNFDYFEVTVDGGRPVRCAGPVYDWRLREGENRLSVRPVNKFGVRGVASRVELVVAPAP